MFAILHPDMLLDRVSPNKMPIDHEIRAPEDNDLISANKPGLKVALEPFEPSAESQNQNRNAIAFETDRDEEQYFYTRKDMLLFTKRRVQSGNFYLKCRQEIVHNIPSVSQVAH